MNRIQLTISESHIWSWVTDGIEEVEVLVELRVFLEDRVYIWVTSHDVVALSSHVEHINSSIEGHEWKLKYDVVNLVDIEVGLLRAEGLLNHLVSKAILSSAKSVVSSIEAI